MAQGLSPVPPRPQAMPLIPQDVPVYRVLDEKGFFADDTLFLQDTLVEWPDEPNPLLEPMNEAAHEKMVEYLTKLDKYGQSWAQREKKSYVNQLDAYMRSRGAEEAVDDGRKARAVGGQKEVPLMGAKRGRAPKAKSVELGNTAPAPAVMKAKGKFSLKKAAESLGDA